MRPEVLVRKRPDMPLRGPSHAIYSGGFTVSRVMPARIVAAVCGLIALAVAFRAGVNTAAGMWIFAGTVAGALAAAGLAFWFAFAAYRGVANIQWWRSARMALIVGLLFFVAGYVGPLFMTPDNNLGPLIGVFGTGPAGFAVGAVIGLIHALRDRDSGI